MTNAIALVLILLGAMFAVTVGALVESGDKRAAELGAVLSFVILLAGWWLA